ncbi:MAG: metallophosphoesterase family protein [Calditrichia bacterium]
MRLPIISFLLFTFIVSGLFAQNLGPAPSAIIDPRELGYKALPEEPWFGITRRQLYPTSITGPDSAGNGLIIDLQDSTLFGTVYSGVNYFEVHNSDYYYSRYRYREPLRKGRGVIQLRNFIEPGSHSNVNRWKNSGVAAYRLDLWENRNGEIRPLEFHDAAVNFRLQDGWFSKCLTLTEGPIVNLVSSDHPEWLIISLETDHKSGVRIEVDGLGSFPGDSVAIRHEIQVTGLKPETEYIYHVIATDSSGDTLRSPAFSFRSAPLAGKGQLVFAYTGDGRAGVGGGEREYLGVNRYILQQIGAAVYRKGADFLLFGGDMVNGYTNFSEDFILQFKAFKQSLSGLLSRRPFYTAMGNHEALLNVFDDGTRWGLQTDKWPYESHSVEARFSQQFVHPRNGPENYPGTPPYLENVYSFQYGMVKVIVFNNNYWWTSHHAIPRVGGSPEPILGNYQPFAKNDCGSRLG